MRYLILGIRVHQGIRLSMKIGLEGPVQLRKVPYPEHLVCE